MSNEKQRFMEAVNKVLIQFESARRDSRFLDKPNDTYRLSENQREDLKQFLVLNGNGQVSLQTSINSEVRDLVVLFSALGLFGPKGRIIVIFPNNEILQQIFSKTTVLWYQLLGLHLGLAIPPDNSMIFMHVEYQEQGLHFGLSYGTKEDDDDLENMNINIIFTTRDFVDADMQIKRLLAGAEIHMWEGSEETGGGWRITQSQSWQSMQPQSWQSTQPQTKKWWEFWK